MLLLGYPPPGSHLEDVQYGKGLVGELESSETLIWYPFTNCLRNSRRVRGAENSVGSRGRPGKGMLGQIRQISCTASAVGRWKRHPQARFWEGLDTRSWGLLRCHLGIPSLALYTKYDLVKKRQYSLREQKDTKKAKMIKGEYPLILGGNLDVCYIIHCSFLKVFKEKAAA